MVERSVYFPGYYVSKYLYCIKYFRIVNNYGKYKNYAILEVAMVRMKMSSAKFFKHRAGSDV
jgi:hypothetical protein